MHANSRVKSFIDRILRLKEEQDALAADIREVYAEAKGEGYDKTAMGEVVSHLRKVEKKGKDAVNERGALFDLYLTAYENPIGTDRATHTHAPDAAQSYADQKGRGETVEVPSFVAVTSGGAEYHYDASTGEIIDNHNEGEGHYGAAGSEQRVGRADGKQRGAAPVPGADGRGEDADDGDQGQGAGASGADRVLRPVAGTFDREDEDRGSRHVGGEVDHEISPSEGGAFVAVMGAARLANAESVEPSPSDTNSDATAQSEPEVTGLAPRATYSPDPHPSQADGGQPQTSNEAGAKNDGLQAIVGRAPTGEAEDGQFEEQQASAAQDRNKPVSASGAAATLSEPFEPPAFLRKTITDYRPLCQRPEACWSSGLKHCHSCQKIADAAESEAA